MVIHLTEKQLIKLLTDYRKVASQYETATYSYALKCAKEMSEENLKTKQFINLHK